MLSDSSRNKLFDMSSDVSSSSSSGRSWLQVQQEHLDRSLVMPTSNKNSTMAAGLSEKEAMAYFYMYEFKVNPCPKGYAHDWTYCPFYHPDERAKRRDLKRFPYTCIQCMDFRKAKSCPKGEHCEFAHGMFEMWLHPGLYKAKVCKDREHCRRKLCFFAHTADELRPIYKSTGCALQTYVGSLYRTEDGASASIGSLSTGSLEASSSNVDSPQKADSLFSADRSINFDIGKMYRLQEAQLFETAQSRLRHHLGKFNKSRMQLGYDYEDSSANSEHQQSMSYVMIDQRSHPCLYSPSAQPGWLQNSGLQTRPRSFLQENVSSHSAVSGSLNRFASPLGYHTGDSSIAQN